MRVVNDLAEPTSLHWHGVRDERPIARLVYQRGSEARPARRSAPLPFPPNPLPAGVRVRRCAGSPRITPPEIWSPSSSELTEQLSVDPGHDL